VTFAVWPFLDVAVGLQPETFVTADAIHRVHSNIHPSAMRRICDRR